MTVMAPVAGTRPDKVRPFRLRLEHVELLQREGSLGERRVELIDGVLFEMSPQQRPHSYAKNELNHRLRSALEALGSPLTAQVEVTLPLAPHSAPEPDIVLTTAPKGQGYIPTATVALIVEIADTSLRYDLESKSGLYAAAGIPEYWVVDVNGRQIHQFWSPEGDGYGESRRIGCDGPISAVTLPDLTLDGSGIL